MDDQPLPTALCLPHDGGVDAHRGPDLHRRGAPGRPPDCLPQQQPHGSVFLHHLDECTHSDREGHVTLALGVTNLSEAPLRLLRAAPLLEHQPDLVLHGHAHAGAFEGQVGEVPVFNVSVPVMKRDFWVFELSCAERRSSGPEMSARTLRVSDDEAVNSMARTGHLCMVI